MYLQFIILIILTVFYIYNCLRQKQIVKKSERGWSFLQIKMLLTLNINEAEELLGYALEISATGHSQPYVE